MRNVNTTITRCSSSFETTLYDTETESYDVLLDVASVSKENVPFPRFPIKKAFVNAFTSSIKAPPY